MSCRAIRLALACALVCVEVASADHPKNARAAAECARLFYALGDLEEAQSFVDLGTDESLTSPAVMLAATLVGARKGQSGYDGVERMAAANPPERPEAARTLLRGAADLLDRGRTWEAGVTVMTALEIDPSILPQVKPWALATVRARITAKNAGDLTVLLRAVSPPRKTEKIDRDVSRVIPQPAPDIVALSFEVAQRAMAMHWPKIAAGYAWNGLDYETPLRSQLARLLVDAAEALAASDRPIAYQYITYAFARDPDLKNDERALWIEQMTAPCGRTDLLRAYLRKVPAGAHARQARVALTRRYPPCDPHPFPAMMCPVGESPFFKGTFESNVHFFPAAANPSPLFDVRPGPRAADEARACRALLPPLFPEPFEANRMGRQDLTLNDREIVARLEVPTDRPCIQSSTLNLIVDDGGTVRGATVSRAQFANENDSPAAAAIEQTRMPPHFVGRKLYTPARIRNRPVWATTWVGFMRYCERER